MQEQGAAMRKIAVAICVPGHHEAVLETCASILLPNLYKLPTSPHVNKLVIQKCYIASI